MRFVIFEFCSNSFSCYCSTKLSNEIQNGSYSKELHVAGWVMRFETPGRVCVPKEV